MLVCPKAGRAPRRGRRSWLRAGVVTTTTAAAAIIFAACGGGGSGAAKGEVTITCASCQQSPTDPFLQYNYEAVQRFNRQFAGRYHVKVVKNQYASSGPDRLQYYQRLALANDLPDVFLVNRAELVALEKTGKLMDFASGLNQDAKWKSSFYDGAFDALKGDSSQIWAIPEERDAIGIYYNKAVLRKAGVTQFPSTWAELSAGCAKVKAKGNTCLAMDGDWVTLLMWANLIGTQPGGPQFLSDGLAKGGYAGNGAVVKATETLKSWHTDGFVNRDAFSGDYANAAAAYAGGKAAMVANGPWMVPTDIKSKNAVKGLYAETGYAPSPGWSSGQRGLVVVAGNGGWVSGARDDRKKEAVTAFMKFLTSPAEGLAQTLKTGAYPAVHVDLSGARAKALDPLAAGLVKQSTSLSMTYPHVYFSAPAAFGTAWKNLWPAYVQNKMSTSHFLDQLGKEATSPTG
jgi:raffinose/stachyose/melibiose transport system substrate-binding protein